MNTLHKTRNTNNQFVRMSISLGMKDIRYHFPAIKLAKLKNKRTHTRMVIRLPYCG